MITSYFVRLKNRKIVQSAGVAAKSWIHGSSPIATGAFSGSQTNAVNYFYNSIASIKSLGKWLNDGDETTNSEKELLASCGVEAG
jgi:hypothetical protein